MADNYVLEALYPAIVECFTIILLGYVTGRAGWITFTQAKGLSTYTSKFALPALLFYNMAILDWSQVEWLFLASILISKASLFLIVLFTSLLLQRPSNIGLASLAAISATQSNDFALGYPIVKAIYGSTMPEIEQYIYLIAPISLVILNPIGFVLLEVQKASSHPSNRGGCGLVVKVIQQVLTNPIIISAFLGVAMNFICDHNLPAILDSLLNTLGQSFSAPALFILGLSMVGKFNQSAMSVLTACGLLVFAKLLLFPVVAMAVTRGLGCGAASNHTAEYSMFAFLYGTFPTAPTVFIYSAQYGVAMDLMATSLVVGTAVSAPLMFTSASMVGIEMFPPPDQLFTDTSVDVSVITIILLTIALLLMLVTRRVMKKPYMMVAAIALFQVLVSVGVLNRSIRDHHICSGDMVWTDYFTCFLHVLGTLGVSTMCTAAAAAIYVMSCRRRSDTRTFWILVLLYGLGFPVVLSLVCLLTGPIKPTKCHGLTQFGWLQTIIVVVALALNLIITLVLLILRHRYLRHPHYTDTPTEETEARQDEARQDEASSIAAGSVRGYDSCSLSDSAGDKKPLLANGRLTSTLPQSADVPAGSLPASGLSDSRAGLAPNSTADTDTPQLGSVVALLIIILICQVMVLFFYVWSLADTDQRDAGMLSELKFIYIIAHAGQGFFTFLIFGLGSHLVLAPIKKLLCKLEDKIRGGRLEAEISGETTLICRQFVLHHMHHCVESIDEVECKQAVHRSAVKCFYGITLSRWLIDVGLAADSTEAQLYADQLLKGAVVIACNPSTSTSFYDTSRHTYTVGTESDLQRFSKCSE